VAITSRQNPIVARYRAAARGDAGGTLLLDGAHLLADAIRCRVTVQHAAVTHAAQDQQDVRDLVAALTRAGVDVVTVSASVMDAISPVRSSTGLVALAERPAESAARVFAGNAPLVVIGVDIQDPGNVGAIVRVAEAGGATGVVIAGASADPFGWKALRGSMGSALRLPLAALSIEEAVDEARRHGCRILATAPRGGRPLVGADLTGPLAILIGGEGQGLAPSLSAAADESITIPMQPPVESLNAAVTAALIVYEAKRQRS
jgi:TrmH family RNA methyltransferase